MAFVTKLPREICFLILFSGFHLVVHGSDVAEDVIEAADQRLRGKGQRVRGFLRPMDHCEEFRMSVALKVPEANLQQFCHGLLPLGFVQLIHTLSVEDKDGNLLKSRVRIRSS